MFRLSCEVVGKFCFLLLFFSLVANFTWAQSETATVSGQVVDPSGLNLTGAQVKLVDIDRGTGFNATTNAAGLYTFLSVRPGRYRMEVTAAGFKVIDVTGLIVNVQDHIEQNFRLQIGSVAESVTVTGGAPLVNTSDAAVSTVVDRQFADNLPMNGRSFQTLIELTPGVVVTTSSFEDSGQFSVNGQRADANYWMVDGVSANIGIGVNSTGYVGNGLSGSVGSFSAMGGTNSLVSVDALQEFRIQTSTYAPEFGRTPGGQISIVTRSGTNQFHGTAFDYVRNDFFDASNWFNGYTNTPPLPKAKERQNDFGGTLSGPILKDRTFFFFSYEGIRLRLPQTALTDVPDQSARQSALPAIQPYFNAFPVSNGAELGSGEAEFNASYSNPATLNAYSMRIDHRAGNNLNLFGRYNYSPSDIVQRGPGATYSLNTVDTTGITTQTATIGGTWIVSPTVTNDLRFNYSRTSAKANFSMDNFGGAVPLTSPPFPGSFNTQNAEFGFWIFDLEQGVLQLGPQGHNLQRQINVVDSLSMQRGSHSLKFGVDFRRLSPIVGYPAYSQSPYFLDVPSAESGIPLETEVQSSLSPGFLFRDLGIYAQDTWRASGRFTVTYGLRWDVDFVPQSNPRFPALLGFSFGDLSNLTLAPVGTPPYTTTYGNVAPRVGIAWELSRDQRRQTVLRGGFGVFYDLATSEMGNQLRGGGVYPFGAFMFDGGAFPLSPAMAAPLSITTPSPSNPVQLSAFDPDLRLPYTLQWNAALEQALGNQQTISVSYLGAAGRRLLESLLMGSPTPSFSQGFQLVANAGTSDYNALQVQFQRRLSRGLQALASYSWSHSIDTGSAGSTAVGSNILVPSAIAGTNRGPSDFDIRNAFSTGLTYDVPAPKANAFAHMILRGWSAENVIQARSAPPVNVFNSLFYELSNGFATDARPDVVAGQPFYLYGSQYPGGKAINPAAFTAPSLVPPGCNPAITFPCFPATQGNLSRNALRGFGAAQWDFAVHRTFPIHESLKVEFRAELFNILNHPNFGPPVGDLNNSKFGESTQMLGQSLDNQNQGGGSFSPLYQIGGPRSVQFALKLQF